MSVALSLMTFNLHEDQQEDSPNSWVKRRDLCISVITSYSPMILCTQQGAICFHFLSFDIRSCVCGSCLWVVLLMKSAIWVVLGLCFGGGLLLFWDVVEFCYWNVWPVNRLLFKL